MQSLWSETAVSYPETMFLLSVAICPCELVKQSHNARISTSIRAKRETIGIVCNLESLSF
ncbi:hypothetical protein FEDK69T_16820 [Flavobacterium enshiense DK69]|nr:hypothetical protein FEDK69T_16820 [Flavobacterium enshiense DK69]